MRLDDDLKYFEEPEFKEILAKYETARSAGSSIYMDADELTDVAEYYAMVLNDKERADEAVGLALQLHPDAVDPQIFRARQVMQDGDIDGARMICDAIDDQQHREVVFLRGELLLREGKNSEALQYLMQIGEGIVEERDYYLFDSAYIFIDYQDSPSALQLANELEALAPQWFKTWELMADVHLSLEHFDLALSYIEKMLDTDPFYVDGWNWRAEAYSGLNDMEKAIESTDFALAVVPTDERALQLKAWALLQKGNLAEAHKLYEQLIHINPDNELHYLYDSYCMLDSGDTDAAYQLIRRAEELSGGNSQEQVGIYEQFALVLCAKHDMDGALKYIDLAEQCQLDAKEEKMDYDLLRARVYAECDHFNEAIACIHDSCVHENHDYYLCYFKGAQVMFETGYTDTALEMFKEILLVADAKELSPLCYPYIAACYHDIGDTASALDYLRKAIDAKSENLQDIMGFLFNEGVAPSDYYDYYYYQVYGCWPTSR